MKKIFSTLFMFICYLVGGGLIGVNTAMQLDFIEPTYMMFFAMIFFIISLYLNMVIHEFGHMLFGHLSGYEIVSIRFGNSLYLKNDEGKYNRKKYSVPCTAGQCLMRPKKIKNKNKYPFFLYHAGGGIINLITGAICILLWRVLLNFPYLSAFFFSFAVFAFVSALTNLVPLAGITNDGNNILRMLKNKNNDRTYVYNTLSLYAEFVNNKRYKEINDEYFEFDENHLKSSDAYTVAAYKISRYMDEHDFENAKILAQKLVDLGEGICPINEIIVRAELLFLELTSTCDVEKINALYTKKLKNSLQGSSYSLSIDRIGYAYEKLFTKNEKKAIKYLKAFEKVEKNYPFEKEIEMEREFIAYINKLTQQEETQ